MKVGGAEFPEKTSKEQAEKGLKQWHFIHGLLKMMVLNTMTCILRLRTGNNHVFIKRGFVGLFFVLFVIINGNMTVVRETEAK